MNLTEFEQARQRIDALGIEQLEGFYELLAREANVVMGGSYALLNPSATDAQSLAEIALRCLEMRHMKQATPESLRQRARLALSNLYIAIFLAPEHIGAWQRITAALEKMSSPPVESGELEELRANAKRGEQAEAHLRAILNDSSLGLAWDEWSGLCCNYCQAESDTPLKGEFPHAKDCDSPIVKARKWLTEQEGRQEEQEGGADGQSRDD